MGNRQRSHTTTWHTKTLNFGISTHWLPWHGKLICFDIKQASDHVPFYEKPKKEYMPKIKRCIVFIRSTHNNNNKNKPVIHWKIGTHIKINIKKRSIYIRQYSIVHFLC